MQRRSILPSLAARPARWFTSALLAGGLWACGNSYNSPSAPLPPSTIVTATGDLTAKLAEFRAMLGDPKNGGNVGPQATGRREISWDGVPAANTNTNDFPVDFFNSTTKLGLILATSGSGFRVSDNDFGDVNALYDGDFEDFSPAKTFMSIGSAVSEVTFRVPGTAQVATVRGFGVVFSDVDRVGSTALEFYDAAGRLIARAVSPARNDAKGNTFVGVVFQSALVARVRIISGQAALGASVKDISDGGSADLVVMDDFLYAEPVGQ
jgi:hypothetical protein